jgi:voltage-gated potassium channel
MNANQTKTYIYDILNPEDRTSALSNGINIALILLILINVTAAAMQTVEGFQIEYRRQFLQLEILSVLIFTFEFVLRLWSAPCAKNYTTRLGYLTSFGAIIDILAIAPFYLSLFIGVDLRALIALRLLRLLKLVRYFEALSILGAVLKAELRAFTAAMFVLMILVFIAATGIYFFEREAQPDTFGSIPQSMWWAIVTLTTLGYGDVVPVTIAGRIFAASITILSIGTVALPAGMLASRFSEELRKRKIDLAEKLQATADGGTMDNDQLEAYSRQMCLSVDDVSRLCPTQAEHAHICPLCGSKQSYVE